MVIWYIPTKLTALKRTYCRIYVFLRYKSTLTNWKQKWCIYHEPFLLHLQRIASFRDITLQNHKPEWKKLNQSDEHEYLQTYIYILILFIHLINMHKRIFKLIFYLHVLKRPLETNILFYALNTKLPRAKRLRILLLFLRSTSWITS